ncbi:MAG: hypothetical protein ACRC2R_16735 [Xenococcaceae cyanobacterium]
MRFYSFSGNGGGALLEIKKRENYGNISISMIITMVDNKNLGYALEATEYLLKPLDYGDLKALLSKNRIDRVYSQFEQLGS